MGLGSHIAVLLEKLTTVAARQPKLPLLWFVAMARLPFQAGSDRKDQVMNFCSLCVWLCVCACVRTHACVHYFWVEPFLVAVKPASPWSWACTRSVGRHGEEQQPFGGSCWPHGEFQLVVQVFFLWVVNRSGLESLILLPPPPPPASWPFQWIR